MGADDTTLLTRLVERQRSRRPSLSPVLSSRFEPPSSDPDVPGAGLDELEEHVPAQPAQPRAARPPSPVQPRLPADRAESPALVDPTLAEPEATPQRTVEVTGRHDSFDRTPRPSAPDERVVVRPGTPGRDGAPSKPPPPLLEVTAESVPSERAGAPSTSGPRTQNDSADTRLPEPLVRPAREQQPDAETAGAESQGERAVVTAALRHHMARSEAARPPAEQPLTVSVRIGRIEVRGPAQHSVPPAADAARRSRHEPRISLEDYLARPNRGWS